MVHCGMILATMILNMPKDLLKTHATRRVRIAHSSLKSSTLNQPLSNLTSNPHCLSSNTQEKPNPVHNATSATDETKRNKALNKYN